MVTGGNRKSFRFRQRGSYRTDLRLKSSSLALAAAAARVRTSSFRLIWVRRFFTVPTLRCRRDAISRLGIPVASSCSNSISRAVRFLVIEPEGWLQNVRMRCERLAPPYPLARRPRRQRQAGHLGQHLYRPSGGRQLQAARCEVGSSGFEAGEPHTRRPRQPSDSLRTLPEVSANPRESRSSG